MDPRYKPRPLCRHCRRRIQATNESRECASCRKKRTCRTCYVYRGYPIGSAFCGECHRAYKLACKIRNALCDDTRQYSDGQAERIAMYAARAARGEPIFDADRNPLLDS